MMKGRKQKIKLCELAEDLNIYPRQVVDEVHVADLLYAHQAGAVFPPIVIDDVSKRIIDGFHRHRMYRRALGPDAEIEVEAKLYANDGQMLLDSARLNSRAARKLCRSDQVRVIIKAREMGIDDDNIIALSLCVTPERVQTLSLRIAVSSEGESIPTKQGTHHVGGGDRVLTPEQVRTIRGIVGAPQIRRINELIELLGNNLLSLEDAQVCQRLLVLANLIYEKVPRNQAEAA